MARILLVHEDGHLRAVHRKLYERQGHDVSEISAVEDCDALVKHIPYDQVITRLAPLADDSLLFDSSLSSLSEVLHGPHSHC